MSSEIHPTDAELRSLLRGQTDPEQQSELLRHLEACPACFTAVDALWSEISPVEWDGLTELPAAESERIEGALLRRLHRTRLAENAAHLGSRGFLFVVLGLLGPFLSLLPSQRRSS